MNFSEIYPDSCSSVALAVRCGNLTRLKELIQEKKPFEIQDNRGWRPVHEAAYWNHSHCLEYLLSLGKLIFTIYFCLRIRLYILFYFFFIFGDIQINSTTFEGQTALWLAAYNNCIASVGSLLNAKAMVNIPNNEDVTPLHIGI